MLEIKKIYIADVQKEALKFIMNVPNLNLEEK